MHAATSAGDVKKVKIMVAEDVRAREGGVEGRFARLACGPRFPYLSFPDAYVLLGPAWCLATHDKAARGGITEGTYNVMYYT